MYRKLKRTYSFGNMNYIRNLYESFPELKKVDEDEMVRRFRKMKMEFYYEEITPVKWWIRLTLPFALVTMLFMFIFIPIVFLVTGKWTYELNKKNRVYNWFKSLKLL